MLTNGNMKLHYRSRNGWVMSLTLTNWGWHEVRQTLIPISSDLPPAPEELLYLISCGCRSECGSKCSCRIAGLPCSMICSRCKGRSCLNGAEVINANDPDYS
ncbi:hypothetical protein PR048_002050 [Dryococelus australis]|uniref:Uncharacterized protein n=1 Tax=Dryococelus australis TaxID=614101 RepID=A0ABQ9IJ30_9NEOP|nr:hypothetical protein PR048_002050 [Dryococelus australis]